MDTILKNTKNLNDNKLNKDNSCEKNDIILDFYKTKYFFPPKANFQDTNVIGDFNIIKLKTNRGKNSDNHQRKIPGGEINIKNNKKTNNNYINKFNTDDYKIFLKENQDTWDNSNKKIDIIAKNCILSKKNNSSNIDYNSDINKTIYFQQNIQETNNSYTSEDENISDINNVNNKSLGVLLRNEKCLSKNIKKRDELNLDNKNYEKICNFKLNERRYSHQNEGNNSMEKQPLNL